MSRTDITKQRISETLDKIVKLFQEENVPQKIAIATFPPYDVPSNKWSLCNRIIMMISGTSDARGYKQWQEVGRYIKKGEKAFYILAPRMIKKTKEEENQEDNKIYICTGFIPIPVFSVEQTDGKSLEYQQIELPALPLLSKAREWNIDVQGIAFQGKCYGYYEMKGGEEKIRLATVSEKTFFHELSHAGHKRIKGYLKGKQDPKQEIVAELSAQVLAHLVGTELKSTLGNSYEYIEHYALRQNKSVGKACLSVLTEVEKILTLILNPVDEEVKCRTSC